MCSAICESVISCRIVHVGFRASHVKNMFLNPANVTKSMHVSKQRTFAGTGNMADIKDVRILQPTVNVFVGYELCIQNVYFF